ncbi:MAG: Gfo/Idh/MocA family oxidoreductase [Sedimentisphaerales bacterium]|nr:Gfo/Idh/MocA family oxidoreductase [Sedimentisphaerales bacterium]
MRRRDFLKHSALATAGLAAFPGVITSRLFGQHSPNNKINIAQIGCGRIARTHDIPETIKYDTVRFVAVADFDIQRARDGKKLIEDYYAEKTGNPGYVDVKVYQDYRELLADKTIDAVIISTPDHWHAQPAIEAALAGKDIYLQKPATLTIAEGRLLSDVVHRTGRVFQIGSQLRSVGQEHQFLLTCELVRNGRIGELKKVLVGLPGDPAGEFWPEMPVPENLDYDAWLGSTPETFYTENRVHSQSNVNSRPGWLRVEQFGAGMITGWGAHYLDIAHWGMDTEHAGPIEIEADAQFPERGLWTVHGEFTCHARYANGVTMEISSSLPYGVRFVGSDGWIQVARGKAKVTPSDPNPALPEQALSAGDPKILESKIGPNEIHLYRSEDHHLNWLECIRSRELTIAPVEVAHRSCSACLLHHIAMKLSGKLYWDPERERFLDNDEANHRLERTQRYPYGTSYVKI